MVKALVITGSSGLYESAMGDGYPRRGDYDFIKKKAQDVFYDPAVATKEIVDEVFATVNDRKKIIKTLMRPLQQKSIGLRSPLCNGQRMLPRFERSLRARQAFCQRLKSRKR